MRYGRRLKYKEPGHIFPPNKPCEPRGHVDCAEEGCQSHKLSCNLLILLVNGSGEGYGEVEVYDIERLQEITGWHLFCLKRLVYGERLRKDTGLESFWFKKVGLRGEAVTRKA